MSSTRSVGMSLARRFNAGTRWLVGLVAWRQLNSPWFQTSLRDVKTLFAFPGLERPG